MHKRTCLHTLIVAFVISGLPCLAQRGRQPESHPSGHAAALADIKTMTVADGLEVSLFACEPEVVNPCDMDIDARGRVWITEGANYRSSFQRWGTLRPDGDRIVILEDTNRDGVEIGRAHV